MRSEHDSCSVVSYDNDDGGGGDDDNDDEKKIMDIKVEEETDIER